MEGAGRLASNAEGWVIEPRREGAKARARDVWRYRKLLRFFARKALEKGINRTILGRAWLFIRPLFPLFVKTIVFGGVLGVGSYDVPYFLFLVVGTSIWELFASAAMWCTRSLELNRGFLSKIYVPRVILPVAMLAPSFLTFAIHLAVVAAAVVYYRIIDGVTYLALAGAGWAALSVVLATLLALGIGLWTSVPALVARDVRFTLNYVLGFWVYLTPVLYPLPTGGRWGWLLALNPMVGIVEAFKHGVLGLDVLRPRDVGVSAAIVVVVLISGLWFFSRAEGDAADKV